MSAQIPGSLDSKTKEASLTRVIEKERDKLLSFINNRTPTIEDAEDILQDVFYELIQSDAIEKSAAWLYKVARNKITDWYRKMRPERLDTISINHQDYDEILFLSDIIPSMDSSADDLILRKLISEELAEALEELPDKQREVFVLHELEGKSLKEIADITGAGIKTVISRKRYAVLYIQDRLKDLYNELLTK